MRMPNSELVLPRLHALRRLADRLVDVLAGPPDENERRAVRRHALNHPALRRKALQFSGRHKGNTRCHRRAKKTNKIPPAPPPQDSPAFAVRVLTPHWFPGWCGHRYWSRTISQSCRPRSSMEWPGIKPTELSIEAANTKVELKRLPYHQGIRPSRHQPRSIRRMNLFQPTRSAAELFPQSRCNSPTAHSGSPCGPPRLLSRPVAASLQSTAGNGARCRGARSPPIFAAKRR